MAIKASVGMRDWGALYQQDPVLEEGQEFQGEWFKKWSTLPKNLRYVTAVDLAISKRDTADDSVVITIAKAPDDKIFIVEYRNWKASPSEVIDEIYRQNGLYNSTVAIEAVGYQQALMHYMSLEGRKRGKYLHVEPVFTRSKKEEKIRGLIPYYSNGLVFHPPNNYETLEDQLKRFPSGRHDDVIDAMAIGMPFLRRPQMSKCDGERIMKDIGLKWGRDGMPFIGK